MNYDYIESLIRKIKAGDNTSKELLIEEFRPLIINISKKTHIHGYEFCDIKNECYKILFKCVKLYDIDKHRFIAYATNGIKNSINDLIRKSINQAPVNSTKTLLMDEVLENTLRCEYNCLDEILLKKTDNKLLKIALEKLSSEEKDLIYNIFFKKSTLINYSRLKNISYYEAKKLKNNILDKLFMYINVESHNLNLV